MISETITELLKAGLLFASIVAIVIAAYFGLKRIQGQITALQMEKDKLFRDVPGFQEFFNFFQNKDSAAITRHMDMLYDLAKELRLYREEKEVLQNVLRATGVDEPTAQIYARIAENYKLFTRFREHRNPKIYIRDNFVSFPFIRDILRDNDSIFIESGSTLAYASLAIVECLRDIFHHRRKMILVCTNNIIVYILLLFEELIEPKLLPGLPTNAYGATFGDRTQSDSCDTNAVKKFLDDNKVTALFTTASFISPKFGPHVSSKANHDIKIVLNDYATERDFNNVLVISSEKIETTTDIADFRSKECKLIFDREGRNIGDVLADDNIRSGVQSAWKSFLSKGHNSIMLGSDNSDATSRATHLLETEHPTLVDYPIPGKKEGLMSLLQHRYSC